MIRVLVVDDHHLVRAGLITLLEAAADIQPAGQAADGPAGPRDRGGRRPGRGLMDLSMPVMDGIAATRLLSAELPGTRVVALTSFSDRQRPRPARPPRRHRPPAGP